MHFLEHNTKEPQDPRTAGPRDQRTAGEEDTVTRGPQDHKTRGPELSRTWEQAFGSRPPPPSFPPTALF